MTLCILHLHSPCTLTRLIAWLMLVLENASATPKLTLPVSLLSSSPLLAFPRQNPLTHTLSHFTRLSIPPASHSPAPHSNTQHLVPNACVHCVKKWRPYPVERQRLSFLHMLRETLLEKLRRSRSFGDLASLRPRPKSSLEVYVSVLRPLNPPYLTLCVPPSSLTQWGCSLFCWCGYTGACPVHFCGLQVHSLHVFLLPKCDLSWLLDLVIRIQKEK